MAPRTRVQNVDFPSGGNAHFVIAGIGMVSNQTQNGAGFRMRHAQCDDIIGSPHADHTLNISKYGSTCSPLNGRNPPGQNEGDTHIHYQAWYPTAYLVDRGHLATAAFEDEITSATKLMARTSPNRVEAQVIVDLVEFRELPRLLQTTGRSIYKRISGEHLKWQFGIAPLISDIRKLGEFQSRVNKRAKEFHHLYNKGGLRRRRTLQQDSKELTESIVIESVLSNVLFGNQQRFTTAKRWGTVRWLPTSLPPVSEAANRWNAFRAVYGLEASFSNVWESVPWTWLIDWFSNVGDYLSTYNHVVPVTCSTPNIMTQIETTTVITPTNLNFGISGGSYHGHKVDKIRHLVGAGISAGIPFLTGRQLSILGALAILKH